MSTGTSASTLSHPYSSSPSLMAGFDGMALRSRDAAILLGRILMGGIFVVSGYGKLMGLSAFAGSLEKNGVPMASAMAPIGAAVEFFGGLAVVLGLEIRVTALLMIGFVIVATLISHRFWEVQGAARQMQQVQFSKNVAIIGGFVLMFALGGGRFAMERLWRRA